MVNILEGDAKDVLKELPGQYFHCCVTSPPYWGLRDYQVPDVAWADGWVGQLGLEPTPQMYIDHLCMIFSEVYRTLRDDGLFWVNIADSYAQDMNGAPMVGQTISGAVKGDGDERARRGMGTGGKPHRNASAFGVKHKELVGIPWMLAFALREQGWYIRQDNIWEKPVPMPESVEDRATKAHEYVFMFSKRPHYFYDYVGSLEPTVDGSGLRNRRTVWKIEMEPFIGEHYAPFPSELPRKAITASTSNQGCCSICGCQYERDIAVERPSRPKLDIGNMDERGVTRVTAGLKDAARYGVAKRETLGWVARCDCGAPRSPSRVLDPFGGSGTTGRVATEMGRDCTLIDLNARSVGIARRRAADVTPTWLTLLD